MTDLTVRVADELAATLHHDRATDHYSLRYRRAWADQDGAFAFSPSLPLPRTPGAPPHGSHAGGNDHGDPQLHDGAVRRFFDHLLPQGDVRRQAAQALNVAPTDGMSLLRALGRETPGALQILPGTAQPARGTGYRPLPREEFSERLRARDAEPFCLWDGQVRAGLSNERDALAIYLEPEAARDGGHPWVLVDRPELASTHVLKPAPRGTMLASLPFNEFFCMRLAQRVGLPVAKVELLELPEPVLMVERIDRRRWPDGRVRRLPMINGCQALDLPADGRYERQSSGVDRRPTASLAALFALLEASSMALADRRALLDWTLFQLLIGHADAHAAQLSFLLTPGGLRVAPITELICAPACGLGDAMAMAIGGSFDPQRIDSAEWLAFAQQCGVAPRVLAQHLSRLCRALLEAAPALADELAAVVPSLVSRAIVDVVLARCERQLALAATLGKAQRMPA